MIPVRVLIIEDDVRISKVHAKFLFEVENFELVGVANSIKDGKEMVEILSPDLILLDLFFPEGNGMELLYELRQEHSTVDVILITAARDIENLNNALKGGVFDYIIKPVFMDRFRGSLQKYENYFKKRNKVKTVDQDFVDDIFHDKALSICKEEKRNLPKGIDPITLKDVLRAFEKTPSGGMSAADIGDLAGLARTTARKYCEYLLAIGELQIKLEYGTIGRPERKYICKKNNQ